MAASEGVRAATHAMLVDKRRITPAEARVAMAEIMAGKSANCQTAAFLAALQQQDLDPEVLRSCAEAMRSFALPCAIPDAKNVIDVVGTGGDGMDTFNVSSAAGIVLAACGLKCAKHGNRSASGSVGSADFLEALGANVMLDGEHVAGAVKHCGFGFLYAQMFHPAMKNVGPVRKEMGVKTIFNLLGPLTNPAAPELQVTGVGSKSIGPLFAELFRAKGVSKAMVVHSSDGLDEISPSSSTTAWILQDNKIEEKTIGPADFGLPVHSIQLVQGGSAAERATLFREILQGGKKRKGEEATHEAVKDYIIANAAAGLWVGGYGKDFASCATIAREAIDSGKALKVLNDYVEYTKECVTSPAALNGGTPSPVFTTKGSVTIHREETSEAGIASVEALVDSLDEHIGMLMMSTFEYPGRYTRWKVGFADPPLQIVTRDLTCKIIALNSRGTILQKAICAWLNASKFTFIQSIATQGSETVIGIQPSKEVFCEEERSRQPSVFSLVREIMSCFFSDQDEHLGLYGAFGYDLTFQFEPCRMRLQRPSHQRDLILFLPDSLLILGYDDKVARKIQYEFTFQGESTRGLPRVGSATPFVGAAPKMSRDHEPGEFATLVRKAKEEFKCGNLFEAVCSQTFYEPCAAPPSELHRRIRERNPSPYSFFINLGDSEYLVGASPEMYVRSSGRRIETCPISGTIARGVTAIEDAKNIKELLNSEKEESELTMCTDVDRNDKSRICVPGSVKVLGRRQIEMYSRLIHTVDHVEGELREGFDALDAFLAHTWAVTVTGAPKAWAMQFLEDNERTARTWYGGAIGQLGFNGNINTGLTLRTIRVIEGVAQVRAGATLLFDSDPDAEEAETQLKASALIDAVRRPRGVAAANGAKPAEQQALDQGKGKRVLLIDHQDSFVHTLANYIRQTGAEVTTIRSNPLKVGLDEKEIDRLAGSSKFDMAVLSPGPGNPSDFQVPATMKALEKRKIPVFGVCLGLQGMVEHYGGKLDILAVPMHGKPSPVRILGETNGGVFEGCPESIICGRYHSLYAKPEFLPKVLRSTAETADGVIMGVQHVKFPVAAVQFHPESILTAPGMGVKMLANALTNLKSSMYD